MLQKLLDTIRGLFGRKASAQPDPRRQGFNVSDRTSNQSKNPPTKPQP